MTGGDLIRELSNPDYPTDGLIFTPDESYRRKWPSLLKWKGTRSTVDLFVRRNDAAECYDLLVPASFAVLRRTRATCLPLNRIPTQQMFWVVMENGLIVAQPFQEIDWISKERRAVPFPFQPTLPMDQTLDDGAVYEFSYDPEKDTLGKNSSTPFTPPPFNNLFPLRVVAMHRRTDKSLQGLSGANDLKTSVSVWESMKYPVTKEELFLLQQNQPRRQRNHLFPHQADIKIDSWAEIFEVSDEYEAEAEITNEKELRGLRRLHNKIKEEVISRATTSRKTVDDKELLSLFGGVIVQERGGVSISSGLTWSLPRVPQVFHILKTVWGVEKEDCQPFGDRLRITERILKQRRATHTMNDEAKVVVDLCCGKGGDLNKYCRNNVAGLGKILPFSPFGLNEKSFPFHLSQFFFS